MEINRRNFISALIGAGAGLALEEAIPFNRVWFFPKTINCVNIEQRWLYGEMNELYRFGLNVPVQHGRARARYNKEHQIWIVQSVDPIKWNIIEATIKPLC